MPSLISNSSFTLMAFFLPACYCRLDGECPGTVPSPNFWCHCTKAQDFIKWVYWDKTQTCHPRPVFLHMPLLHTDLSIFMSSKSCLSLCIFSIGEIFPLSRKLPSVFILMKRLFVTSSLLLLKGCFLSCPHLWSCPSIELQVGSFSDDNSFILWLFVKNGHCCPCIVHQ